MPNVHELTNLQLDRLIAKSENIDLVPNLESPKIKVIIDYHFSGEPVYGYKKYNPSTNWSIAGPIMEREKITVEPHGDEWSASTDNDEDSTVFGETYLEAAMRAYVAAKLGLDFDFKYEDDFGDDDSTSKASRPKL